MSVPGELLGHAAAAGPADQAAATRRAIEGLLALTETDWPERGLAAVNQLRTHRADSPMLLAATAAALERDAVKAARGLRRVLGALDDRAWSADLGLQVTHYASLGVVSLGETTRRVLEAAVQLGETEAQLFTDHRAVAKGLSYLPLSIEVAPPEEAEAVLIPAAAVHGKRTWTSRRAADTALRAAARRRRVVVVAHPLVHLSSLNRRAYRPAPHLVDVKLE